MDKQKYNLGGLLVGTASFFIVVAGTKAASSFLVPILLAVFIATLTTPLLFWLRKFKVPTWLALLLLMLGLGVILTIGATVLLNSINSLMDNLPEYQDKLTEQLAKPLAMLKEHGIRSLDEMVSRALTGKNAITLAASTAGIVKAFISNAFIVLLVVLFILSESTVFSAKLKAIPGMSEKSLNNVEEAIASVRRYMGMKTFTSFITGLSVYILARVFKVDVPVVLAVLAFLLNFVPNIGSIMAAIPGILLALILHGVGSAIGVGIGYLVINTLIGNILEPRIMGEGLGLSPLVVVLSLLLWGWVLGPVGMLLSVPLTTTAKLFMESLDETKGIAILMGDKAPSLPDEK